MRAGAGGACNGSPGSLSPIVVKELFRTPHWVVTEEPDGVIRLERTSAPFDDFDQMESSMEDLNARMDRLNRPGHRLLVDTRQATGRNDPEFEQAFAPHRRRMLEGWQRRAVVVRRVVGQLQVQRHARADGLDVGAFLDPAEARRWLRA